MEAKRRLSPNLKIYSTVQKRKRSRRSPMQLIALRLNDLAVLYRSRYGHEPPNDDAGRDDARIALNHLACLPHPMPAMARWLGIWCPWMTLAEQREISAPIVASPQRWKADALASRLRLTKEQRTMLAITTIGA